MTTLETVVVVYFGIGLGLWICNLFYWLVKSAQTGKEIQWNLKGTVLWMLFWPLFLLAIPIAFVLS